MGAAGLILLDTHVVIWFAMDAPELATRTAERIAMVSRTNAVRVSPISFWETSMLMSKGRLETGQSPKDWVGSILALPGFQAAPFTPDIAADAGSLPPPLHGDPCDRLIVATARALGCVLLTADEKILDYAAAGHLRAEDARL